MKLYKPEMWIPNADIREYFQFWFPNIPDNCNKGVVGLIKNETNEKIKIEIVIDDLWMIENHQRTVHYTFLEKHIWMTA